MRCPADDRDDATDVDAVSTPLEAATYDRDADRRSAGCSGPIIVMGASDDWPHLGSRSAPA
jgi:hypothetical protein